MDRNEAPGLADGSEEAGGSFLLKLARQFRAATGL
jgi:hypothetical protein